MTTAVLADRVTAGGDEPTRFDPIESWYPVFYIEDLNKLNPTPFTLLDRDLVDKKSLPKSVDPTFDH